MPEGNPSQSFSIASIAICLFAEGLRRKEQASGGGKIPKSPCMRGAFILSGKDFHESNS